MEWSKTLMDSGVAIGVLVMLLIGLWRVLVWLATHVVLPVVNSHIGFLKAASESLSQQRVLLDRVSKQLEGLYELMVRQERWMQSHDASVTQIIRSELAIHDDAIVAEGKVCPLANKCPMREHKEEAKA